MKWVDEAAGMEAKIKTSKVCATRHISGIDFKSTARLGDIVEITTNLVKTGNTSLTYSVVVRNAFGGVIATFENLVFVAVDENHNPVSI
jgi:acyl-CoA hydrolase